jgi:methylated-DNA-[protein]-cysteine S-methyltransferase
MGLTRVLMLEASRAATKRRLATHSVGTRDDEPPPAIAQVVSAIQCYARGERVDFSAAVVDLGDADQFRRAVYAATRAVGWGETASYGEIARRIAAPDAREVGQALGRNPIPLIIPCHRIVASDGTLGGFSAPGGRLSKERLLTLEGFGADAPRLPGL